MFEVVLIIALVILVISILTCLYRVFKGPSIPDRVIASDTIGINLMGVVAVVSVLFGTQAFLEVILLVGLLAFIGTVSFSKFLERGVVIEHDRDNQ